MYFNLILCCFKKNWLTKIGSSGWHNIQICRPTYENAKMMSATLAMAWPMFRGFYPPQDGGSKNPPPIVWKHNFGVPLETRESRVHHYDHYHPFTQNRTLSACHTVTCRQRDVYCPITYINNLQLINIIDFFDLRLLMIHCCQTSYWYLIN